jgi:hypothetical protein
VKHLVEFARLSVHGETEADLDAAGDNLAQAVAIIGVDVVLAFLTHRSRAPRSSRTTSAGPG